MKKFVPWGLTPYRYGGQTPGHLKIERRAGREPRGIPVDRARVIGNSDERATHAFGARANSSKGLGAREAWKDEK